MIKKIIDEHGGLLSVITILLIFIAFFVIRKNKMNKEGVFTIAKVIKYESDASGSSLYIEVYFRGEKKTEGKIEYCHNEIQFFNLFDFYYFLDAIEASNYPENKLLTDDVIAEKLLRYAINDA